jgi:hypothetical protein
MVSNWITVISYTPSIVVKSISPGNYEVQVVAIDAFGSRSLATTTQKTVDRATTGATDGGAIEPVVGAAVTASSALLATLTWTPSGLDGLSLLIRHTPDESGGTWANANPITNQSPLGSSGEVLVPALNGCYLLRYTNEFGLLSSITSVVAFSAPLLGTALININESTAGFLGEKENCVFDAVAGGLTMARQFWDDLGQADSLTLPIDSYAIEPASGFFFDSLAENENFDGLVDSIDSYGIDTTTAYYRFFSGYDTGTVGSYELRRLIKSSVKSFGVLWDERTGALDDWFYIDDESSPDSSGCKVALEFCQSTMLLNSETKWSNWAPLVSCVAFARSFRFRAKISNDGGNQNILINSLGVRIS